MLPDPKDLKDLQVYVKSELEKLDLTSPLLATYRNAVNLLQTRLVIYNKRRSGELEATK